MSFRRALGPTQPPIISLEIKRQEREADHSTPTSAEVNSTSTRPHVFIALCLIGHRDSYTPTFSRSSPKRPDIHIGALERGLGAQVPARIFEVRNYSYYFGDDQKAGDDVCFLNRITV
jgi:hypothetical protein